MNILDAVKLANYEINKHLGGLGWKFQLDNSVRRFGQCRHRTRVISMSRPLIELNDEKEVRDTILHEIAHSLTRGDHHGHQWKQACIRIGARPERCYTLDRVVQPDIRYQATCGGCGQVFKKVRKPSGGKRSCRCQMGISWDKRHLLHYIDTKTKNHVAI
jgi:predicted SprT family Zn-dependent metalloprotease